jgi:hypothetical protein
LAASSLSGCACIDKGDAIDKTLRIKGRFPSKEEEE